MKDFTIMTDSCCDLPIEVIEKKKIPCVYLTCSYDGKEYIDDFGKSLAPKKFYDDMRSGQLPKTSQPNSEDFYVKFKEIALDGKDIIYICVSSGLSGTLNSANIAKEMMHEQMPEVKIAIVDVLTASLGQGIMVLMAYEMKEKKISFDKIVDYLEENKQNLNTYITVDDLSHLKRGGRISQAAAILGMVLHIKPVLTLNHEGRVIPVLKVKSRKKVINKLAEILIERIHEPEKQTIAICHGDCLEEAEKIKSLILEKIKVSVVIINIIGPVVGAFGGPGAIAVFFIGKGRQHHIINN